MSLVSLRVVRCLQAMAKDQDDIMDDETPQEKRRREKAQQEEAEAAAAADFLGAVSLGGERSCAYRLSLRRG